MLKIGGGMADSLLIEVLKGDYLMVRDKPTCNDVDRKNNKELLKSIQQVLRFHMTEEEWKEWTRENYLD